MSSSSSMGLPSSATTTSTLSVLSAIISTGLQWGNLWEYSDMRFSYDPLTHLLHIEQQCSQWQRTDISWPTSSKSYNSWLLKKWFATTKQYKNMSQNHKKASTILTPRVLKCHLQLLWQTLPVRLYTLVLQHVTRVTPISATSAGQQTGGRNARMNHQHIVIWY